MGDLDVAIIDRIIYNMHMVAKYLNSFVNNEQIGLAKIIKYSRSYIQPCGLKVHYWTLECICGLYFEKRSTELTRKRKTPLSCGCTLKQNVSQRFKKHGLRYHPNYSTWIAMMRRCYKKHNDHYKYYGLRGIVVCERWHNIKNFIEDMGVQPKGCSIERIDVNRNYEPNNCKWIPLLNQAKNTTRSRRITAGGKTMILQEWANLLKCRPSTILSRLKTGWSEEDAVLIPIRK